MKQNRHTTDVGVSRIGDVLPQLIVRYGLHRRRHWEHIEEAWRQAVGEPYAAVTQVSGIYRGTLTIKVSHSVFVQELSFRQAELIAALGALLADEKIKKIRFVG